MQIHQKSLTMSRYIMRHISWHIFISIFTVVITLKSVHNATNFKEDEINYRLPNNLQPNHYSLYIFPQLKTGNFSGQEVIRISVLQATKQIILHANHLRFTSIYASASNGGRLEIANYEWESQRQFLIIDMVEELVAGAQINLGIIFEGHMLNKINGLYSSSYLTSMGQKRTIATSKFEPTHARSAFPCFDEPAMKATFEITLVYPNEGGYHAVSNMDINREQYQGEYTETYFNTSVPMSTYLICFLISDFEYNAASVNTQGIGSNFEIRLFATPHQVHKVAFALDTAVAVTKFYLNYFRLKYPLPKLDMAAIPDFASNAMEHWGLITYRETALLYDDNYSSTWNKQRVAVVVAHELAHMWFGNLVTMMWWNDIWLNEGFARYMEYKAINDVYPLWGMRDQFLVVALHNVLKFDAFTTSHPIIQPVESPDQIGEVFDTISYEKGASVIRMLEHLVGEEQFEEAVRNYLNENKYQNAISDDFFTQLELLQLGFDVKLMMRTWTEQMGYPIIEVERSSLSTFNVKQKRFLANIDDYSLPQETTVFNYKWTIPITYFTNLNENEHRLLLEYTSINVTINVPQTIKWIKLNHLQMGYYRVNYEADLWKALIDELIASPTTFSIADRANILDDLFALADASQLNYGTALDATYYLAKETEFVPWSVATSKLQLLKTSLRHTNDNTYVRYIQYAQQLIAIIYAQVGWIVEPDNHLRNRLRVSVLTTACALELPECLQEANIRFQAWLINPATDRPTPDLRDIVYYYGMQQSGKQADWETLWDRFIDEQDAAEKLKLMYGLSAIRVPWLLYRLIDLAWNEDNVRRQDYFTCLQNVAANTVGEPIVWEYVREHWMRISGHFGLNDRYLGRMIPSITARFASEIKLEEMEQFFTKYPNAGAGTASRQQAIETVKNNIKWLSQNSAIINEWLRTQKTNNRKMIDY